MFGIIYIVYSGLLHVIANIQYEIKNAITRHDSYDPKTGLSYGIYGETYDETFGGKQVIVTAKNYGRILVRDKKGRLLRDITQERMNQEYQRLKNMSNSSQTVVEWSTVSDEPNRADPNNKDVPWGKRYKDVVTGAIYVKRNFRHRGDTYRKQASKIKNILDEYNRNKYNELLAKEKRYPDHDFYMDIDTGMLIRVADNTYENYKKILKKQCKYSDIEIQKKIKESRDIDDRWIRIFNKRQIDNVEKGMKNLNGQAFYCNSEVSL